MRRALLLTIFGACGMAGLVIGALTQHEPLRLRNDFTRPEEVVRYYVARDASGFVWSGLLEKERQAFTTWSESPDAESFYVADNYEIIPPVRQPASADRAKVEVHYKIRGMSDAYGTIVPAQRPDYHVTFELRRENGHWKIASPQPPDLAPVVLASKFPIVAQNRR